MKVLTIEVFIGDVLEWQNPCCPYCFSLAAFHLPQFACPAFSVGDCECSFLETPTALDKFPVHCHSLLVSLVFFLAVASACPLHCGWKGQGPHCSSEPCLIALTTSLHLSHSDEVSLRRPLACRRTDTHAPVPWLACDKWTFPPCFGFNLHRYGLLCTMKLL